MDEILKRCKCGVYLTVNKHRDVYETTAKAIADIREWGGADEIDEELEQRMNATGQIYELRFYPDTPISFYRVYGTSLEEVVSKANSCLVK